MNATPTPNDDTAVTPATPAAEENKPAEATAAETKPTEPSEPEGAETSPGETPEEAPATPPVGKPRWGAIAVDAALVALVVAVLVAAVCCFRATVNRYHVPTPMEQLLAESEELDQRFNALLPRANLADTQLHMRARLAQLEGQLMQHSAQIAEKKAALDELHGQVLARQYAIRQADETNRGIARSLLPGMPVGDVTTTTGKAYRNATIYRLDKRYIYLRFPEGQVRFPLRHLVKDNLPELARYAFGELDLVDMSDFEQTGEQESRQTPRPATRPASPARPRSSVSYDPSPGAPVLDTDANRTSTIDVPDTTNVDQQDVWDAPSGDLPM